MYTVRYFYDYIRVAYSSDTYGLAMLMCQSFNAIAPSVAESQCSQCIYCRKPLRKLYWAEDGGNGHRVARIAQANMDGTDTRTLYGQVSQPSGLAMDYAVNEDRSAADQVLRTPAICLRFLC